LGTQPDFQAEDDRPVKKPHRADVIALLNRLGANEDAEVLLAARALHHSVAEAGLTWDDLLIPESLAKIKRVRDVADAPTDGADDVAESALGSRPAETDELRQRDADMAEREETERLAAHAHEDLKIVERLLARKDLSEETRRDLLDFSRDIAEDKLTVTDSRYIRALVKRLGL
jgi:hypothetical protein